MHTFIHFIEDLLFPQSCFVCSKNGSGLCAECRYTFQKVPLCCPFCGVPNIHGHTCTDCFSKRVLTSARSVYAYEDRRVEQFIHLIKYKGVFSLLDCVQEDIAEVFSTLDVHRDTVLVPIPQSKERYRERGYNQAELLARMCAQLSGLRCLSLLTTQTPRTQHTRSRDDRLKGLESYFSAHRLAKTVKHAIVIDDILTTGGTCEAAALALRDAGVMNISAFTLARQNKLFQ